MNKHKQSRHPYLLWVIVVGGCLGWLFTTYQLYLLDGFHARVEYTLFSGLPLVCVGGYLLFAIYAAQKKHSEHEAQQQEQSEEVWPPRPTTGD